MSHRKLKYSLFQTGLTLLILTHQKKNSVFLYCYLFIILIIIQARNLRVMVDSSLLNLISILKMLLSLFFLLALDFVPLLQVFCPFLNLVSYLAYFLAWLPFNLYTIYKKFYKNTNLIIILWHLKFFHGSTLLSGKSLNFLA